jgi:uncharacterized protein YPO0396
VTVSLNIARRKLQNPEQIQKCEKTYVISQETLNRVFRILFFIEQKDVVETMQLDQQKKSIQMISRVLHKIENLPLNDQITA